MENEFKNTQKALKEKQKDQTNLFFTSILFICLAILFCTFLWVTSNFMDRMLFKVAFRNGINPTLFLVVLCFIFLAISAILLYISKGKTIKTKTVYIPLALFIAVFAVANVGSWMFYRGMEFKSSQFSEEYNRIKLENEGYVYIGKVIGYNKKDKSEEQFFNLYAANKIGKRFYYCTYEKWSYCIEDMMIVSKYNKNLGIITEINYIIDFEFDWDDNQENTSNIQISKSKDEPKTIKDDPTPEPPRPEVPMQEWIKCGVCKGSTNCQVCGGNGWLFSASSSTGRKDCYSCNGNKKCSACGGRGGEYITVYR